MILSCSKGFLERHPNTMSLLKLPLLALVLAAASLASAEVHKTAGWGKTSQGDPIDLYTLTNAQLSVSITTFGARIVSIETPDRKGAKADVVLGYDNAAAYLADSTGASPTYFGSTVGRYGNRIAKGQFTLDGKTAHLDTNNGPNTLHGGKIGFEDHVWSAREIPNGVEMTLMSPDGDMGFPGELTAHVRFTLAGSGLHLDYSATTNKPTVVNLTNHSYFNLAGNGQGTILGEVLTLPADRYTPIDKGLIPLGDLAPVEGTPFDFRRPTAIGARIDQPNEQLQTAGGYDHNFVLNNATAGGLHLAAELYDPASGRTLKITTTEPGVQFYSGNFLNGTAMGRSGIAYQKYAGLCLETQHFPDSPNQPAFPSTVLRPGHIYHSQTVLTFGVRQIGRHE
jgi:aldose 1-epimerase